MGAYNETRALVASMAQIEDAMEELDDAAGKLEAKIKRLQSLLTINREQKRRLEHGFTAIKTTAIPKET